MTLKFKEDKLPEDHEKRFKYLYRLQEKLRIFHNIKGKQMKDGKITVAQFRRFQHGWFKDRSKLICQEINKCKSELTNEEKEKLLEIDEIDNKIHGAVKDKEKFKVDEDTIIDLDDIEDKDEDEQ